MNKLKIRLNKVFKFETSKKGLKKVEQVKDMALRKIIRDAQKIDKQILRNILIKYERQ